MRDRKVLPVALVLLLSACGESSTDGSPGSGGSAGSAGTAAGGSAGTGGSGGASGSGGVGGTAGTGGAAGSGESGWSTPACTSVTGTWAVRFTSDDGATVSAGDGNLSGVAYTWGLAALDEPNVLIAEHAGNVLRSTDAGCTWLAIGKAPASTTRLAAAPGGRAYGHRMNGTEFYRVQGTTVVATKGTGTSIVGIGTTSDDGARVRVGDTDGQLWESKDQGDTFEKIGTPAPKGCFYAVAFDPKDFDHAVCGTITDGTFVTFDGGKLWFEAQGDATYANTFSLAISPADGNVVWIEGFQLGWHNGQQIGPEGRRVWRSTDGGKTFGVVLEQENSTAKLVNGNLLAPHPTDANVLYFTFGTPPIAGLSSESYLYRLTASGALTEHVQPGLDSYDAVVFSPASPSLIYLGVSSERP